MVDMDKMRGNRDSEREDAAVMLEGIQNATGVLGGIELNEWEEEFIESVETQLDAGRTLSENQMAKLQEIWDKV